MTQMIALADYLRNPRLVYDPEETGIEDVMLFVPSPLIWHEGALRTEWELIARHGSKTD